MNKGLKAEEFVVRTPAGEEAEIVRPNSKLHRPHVKGFPQRPGFLNVNGPHWQPELADALMHDYPAHRNRAVMNVAIRDMADGLADLGTGDHRFIWQWNGNLGYASAIAYSLLIMIVIFSTVFLNSLRQRAAALAE